MKNNHFSAAIKIIDINPYVDVPENIVYSLLSITGRKNGPIPVKGIINGTSFIQTVVKYQGSWRLYVNTQLRLETGLKVGDQVEVRLDYDPDPRIIPMPKKLADALSTNEVARIVFNKLPPSHQKEILQYLNNLKSEEALDRGIKKLIEKELKI